MAFVVSDALLVSRHLHKTDVSPAVSSPESLAALRIHRRRILELAERHGARNVRMFGSTVRGDARPDSDIDILVEVKRGRTLVDVIAFEQDLEELLGRSVEVLTDAGLSPDLQQRIPIEAAAL